MNDSIFPVFVGYDSREKDAFKVTVNSLIRHTSRKLYVAPLGQEYLRKKGIYWRPSGEPASTEFSFTRFLVPWLCNFTGHAMFVDGDFLFTRGIDELIESIDQTKAVSCVHHDYRPTDLVKMDGQKQVLYPRKNWSSLMVFNCGHFSIRKYLDLTNVNQKPASWLHQMQWVADHEIGSIDESWNWLEGWSKTPEDGVPAAIHFTRGGPWFDDWQNVEYADLWREELSLAESIDAS